MAPKKKSKKKQNESEGRCDQMEGGHTYQVPPDEVFKPNSWEIFCFPYILCSRAWDCFMSLCSGTNQCLVYWLMIQWVACKITRLTTPDPIIFPYYFYMFCQVILLTVVFYLLWRFWLHRALVDYMTAFYEAFLDPSVGPNIGGLGKSKNTSRMSFRRYCFRKSEIFDTMTDSQNGGGDSSTSPMYCVAALIAEFVILKMFCSY